MIKEEIEVIIKPIFTKMFDDDFSACEYGIECYKKGMEYQGIKELAIENDNLIKQVKTLKAQIEKMKCCANCNNCRRKFIKKNVFEHTCKVKHCKNYDSWEIKEK